jgi:hypothetical protein
MVRKALILATACVAFVVNAAFGQSEVRTTLPAISGVTTRLSHHATLRRDCTPGPLPELKVIDPPKNGTLLVRLMRLKGAPDSNCPGIELPAQVIFYRSAANFAGVDAISYQTTTAGRVQPQSYTIIIQVKAPEPNGESVGKRIAL